LSYAHRCARRPVCRSGTGACALVPVCVVRAWPHAFACQRVDVCVCGVHPRRTLRGADSGVRIVVLLTVYCRVVGRQTCMLCVILRVHVVVIVGPSQIMQLPRAVMHPRAPHAPTYCV